MNKYDALNILGIFANSVTQEEIKQAYRKAAQQYHPDRNPASFEMMKLVNSAYESLQHLGNIIVTARTLPKNIFSKNT